MSAAGAIRAARRRARLDGRDGAPRDAGLTIAEMTVTMLIMSIVIAATATLAIGFNRTAAENMARQEQIDVARAAVDAMSRTLRTAIKPAQLPIACGAGCTQDAFLEGRATSVRFYANIDNPGNTVGPSQITYTLVTSGPDAGTLVEKIQTPDSNVPGPSGYSYCNAEAAGASAQCKARLRVRPIATGVIASDARPIFAYYDTTGSRMTPPAGGTLTVDRLARVLSIEVRLEVQQQQGAHRVPATEYVQRIVMPNAQAVVRQQQEEENA